MWKALKQGVWQRRTPMFHAMFHARPRSVGIGVVKLVGVAIAMTLIPRFGRRTLLLAGRRLRWWRHSVVCITSWHVLCRDVRRGAGVPSTQRGVLCPACWFHSPRCWRRGHGSPVCSCLEQHVGATHVCCVLGGVTRSGVDYLAASWQYVTHYWNAYVCVHCDAGSGSRGGHGRSHDILLAHVFHHEPAPVVCCWVAWGWFHLLTAWMHHVAGIAVRRAQRSRDEGQVPARDIAHVQVAWYVPCTLCSRLPGVLTGMLAQRPPLSQHLARAREGSPPGCNLQQLPHAHVCRTQLHCKLDRIEEPILCTATCQPPCSLRVSRTPTVRCVQRCSASWAPSGTCVCVVRRLLPPPPRCHAPTSPRTRRCPEHSDGLCKGSCVMTHAVSWDC